jgi:GntR family transcriptional regulator/MocR family aminotransferase
MMVEVVSPRGTDDIFIDPKSDDELSNQIYMEIRSGILEGRCGPGDRLPPTRQLATRLPMTSRRW